MITFDYLTLKSFYKENKDFFSGARVQKIQQPTRRDFLLTIRNNGQTKKLYINISPQIYHLCFITDKTFERRNITIPQKPPMFCMLLRKYIEGFRITNVNLPENERIFEIFFESYDELNEKTELCLAIELMGKYSNVILYNKSSKVIIGCAHNVGAEKSRERELSGTLPYIYPKKQIKCDILSFNGSLDYNRLNSDFFGISTALQNQLTKNSISLDKIKRFISLDYPLSPAYNAEEFSIYSELIDNPKVCESVNEMIDEYFSARQEEILMTTLRLKLKNIISPQHKRFKNLSEKLLYRLSKNEKSSNYQKFADLIMTNLYNSTDYSKEIVVTDWETNKTVKIPLDKTLTLKENAQIYYKMYAKSKQSQEVIKNLYDESLLKTDYFSEMLYSVNISGTLADLEQIHTECEETGLIKSTEKRRNENEIKTEEYEINGFKVYIGKNNKQNNYLISKLSAPNDLWFHVQNTTGSHVLLKITDSGEPDINTIYECAKLAKKFSSAASDLKAGVIYTKRKYLRKPPKANLGYVTYKNEKEIIVE